MASSHQQFRAIFEQVISDAVKPIEEKLEQQNVRLEKMECSMNKVVQVFLENINGPLLQRTFALPSNTSSLPHQPESSASESRFQLCFKYEGNFLACNFLTKINIEDVIPSLTVELLCDRTEKRVPEFCSKDLKVKFFVLDGDLKDDYTEDDFKNCVVKPREYKGPLLKGNSEVSLTNMSARVCGFSFTDNSSKTTKNGKFRLGAQLINGDRFGCIARSAVSPPFQVKENRLKSSLKHTTPKPEDKLYRLKNISENGAIYRRAKEHVDTVMDFLQLYHTDENELLSCCYPNQNPGSNGMKWKETVDNAKECDLSKEHYKYEYLDDKSGDLILLKCDFQIERAALKGQATQTYESLSDFQKEKVNMLRKAAYKKRKELKKVYDSINQTAVQGGSGYLSNVEHQEQQPPALPPTIMDPNAAGRFKQICSIPPANLDNCQQDVMNTSAIVTDAYRVQHTTLEAGTHPSAAYGFPTEQDAFGIDSYPDITAAYQDEMNMQQMSYDNFEITMQSPLYINNFDFVCLEQLADEMLIQTSANIMPKSANITAQSMRRWRILSSVLRWLQMWTILMHGRPQKKQRII